MQAELQVSLPLLLLNQRIKQSINQSINQSNLQSSGAWHAAGIAGCQTVWRVSCTARFRLYEANFDHYCIVRETCQTQVSV